MILNSTKIYIDKFNEKLPILKQIPPDAEVLIVPPNSKWWIMARMFKLDFYTMMEEIDYPLPIRKYEYYLEDYEIELDNGYNQIVGMAYCIFANKLLVSERIA